jgi:hypothetical protein
MGASEKKHSSSRGTKIAAAVRKECNSLPDETRIHLTATAMRLIYHNQTGAKKPSAHCR